jgi:hypothetical protein
MNTNDLETAKSTAQCRPRVWTRYGGTDKRSSQPLLGRGAGRKAAGRIIVGEDRTGADEKILMKQGAG